MNRQLRSFLVGAIFAAIALWLFFNVCSPNEAQSIPDDNVFLATVTPVATPGQR